MKLIKLKDKFILVSDETIKEGDYRIIVDKTSQFYGQFEKHLGTHECNDQWNKIIAGIPELPAIDFSLLKEEDCKKIGYVDIEKLSVESIGNTYSSVWREGFKKAQSLNDKQFSLEDMIECTIEHAKYCQSLKNGRPNFAHWCHHKGKEFIQSLQKTEWDVEVEKEGYKKNGMIDESTSYRPKITNNSIKVTKVL